MEKDQEKTLLLLLLPSTSSVNGDEVSASPAFSAPSTAIQGEGGASSSKEDNKKKVVASEEQIRAVFSNNLVSSCKNSNPLYL